MGSKDKKKAGFNGKGAKGDRLPVSGVRLFELPVLKDERGQLLFAQYGQHVPFISKRFFVIFDVPSKAVRGRHAHRENKQFLVCLKGECLVMVDNGRKKAKVKLDTPIRGLYIPPLVWAEISEISSGAIILVQASHSFSEDDYIRDYSEFLRLKGVP